MVKLFMRRVPKLAQETMQTAPCEHVDGEEIDSGQDRHVQNPSNVCSGCALAPGQCHAARMMLPTV
jgi:hypothetical protein